MEKTKFKQNNRPEGNVKRKKYAMKNSQNENSARMEGDTMDSNGDQMLVAYTTDAALEDIAFLRNCKVNDENMPLIQEKLRLTVDERLKMVNQDKTNLLERFPYFFFKPELVCQCAP